MANMRLPILRTTPGSTTVLLDVITQADDSLAADRAGDATARIDRLQRDGRPTARHGHGKYQKGIPFCADTMMVSGPISGRMASAAAVSAWAFADRNTTSCTPSSAGSSVAGGGDGEFFVRGDDAQPVFFSML